MFNEVLQSIDGISIYPIFSLLIFFVFFLGLTIWVIKADKNYLKKMSELPIEK
ncbi:cbb3-type cytochrome c oxidase subunit 3 [soil metagenome]